jgi:hypothetical protein
VHGGVFVTGRRAKKQSRRQLPAVNILSPWVFERMAVRRLRQRFLLAAVALVLLVASGWALQYLRVNQAEQILAVEQAETGRLAIETNALAPVRTFVTMVEQQKQTVQDTMTREIYFSRVLEGVQSAVPVAAQVESLSVTLAPQPEQPVPAPTDDSGTTEEAAPPATASAVSPCPGPDPFNTRVVVGCVLLSGSAEDRGDVGELVIALGENSLFVEPFITTTTTSDGERVTFSGSVGLSRKVFSNRYADLGKLLGTDIEK